MKTRSLTAAAFAALSLLAGCGYNIVPEPPKDLPRADGKPLPQRLAVRDVIIEGAEKPSQEQAEKLVEALRHANVFSDVQRVGAGADASAFDAVLQATYKDTTEQGNIGFVFPPCLIPFIDLCIIPLGHVNIDIGAHLSAAVADGDGRTIKTYDENASGKCSYLPFPGLFPFNLALIGPETSCHNSEGPQAAWQMALAKLVGDLIQDRAALSGARRRAAEPAAENPGSETAPAGATPGEKPWWK